MNVRLAHWLTRRLLVFRPSQTVSKIIRFLPKEFTEKNFLEHFSRLCSDVSFHVRRVCAANFGEFASVVGTELTESVLVGSR